MQTDPERVAERYRAGELDVLDVIRQYGVVLDWGTGELFAESTRQYRDSLRGRTITRW